MEQTITNKPIFIELIGPAGAGKTTLIRSLVRSGNDISIASKPSLRSIGNIVFYIRNSVDLWPIFSCQRLGDRWLSARELWWMLFLNEWADVLERRCQSSRQSGIKLFDHGPMYMLTSLYTFGPSVTRTAGFQQWWHKMLNRWTSFLGLVIWLDASNTALATRINARDTEHPMKGKTDEDIHLFLDRYRNAFKQVLAMVQVPEDRISVLQFYTDQETPDQILERILGAVQTSDFNIAKQVKVD